MPPPPANASLAPPTGSMNADDATSERAHAAALAVLRDELERLSNENERLSIASERLSIENERLSTMLEHAPDGYIEADLQGRILLANREVERMLGYERGELLGRSVEELVPLPQRARHVRHRKRFARGPLPRVMGAGRNLLALRRDGTTVPVEIRLAATEGHAGPRVVASIRDASERRRQEEELQRALEARDALLREVYHRVKNNLQVVSSLLRWQARSAGGSPCASLLEDAQARIHAMAAVHESLMATEGARQVGFASYVRDLIRGMQLSQRMPHGEIEVHAEIDEALSVPLDRAVPCGLILHELVSNAFEHAFPPGFEPGPEGRRIDVHLHQSRHSLSLVVKDSGVGIPGGETERPGALGLEIVRILARQLGGKVLVERGPGTRIEVRCRRARS